MTPAIDAYHRLLAADPAAAYAQHEELLDRFRARNVLFGDEPMRTFLRPHFVDRAHWDVLRDTGRVLLETAARAARVVFDGDLERLFAFLGTPDAERQLVRHDPGPPDVLISRLDAFLTDDGLRYIEVNSDAPAGFGYGDRMAEVVSSLPVFRAFAQDHRVEYRPSGTRLVEAVLALWKSRGGTASPVVAIVDWADVKTRPDQEILRDEYAEAGARPLLCDPRDMTVHDGRLWHGDTAVDVVYRRVVQTELATRTDEVEPFLRAYRENLALFANSLRCHLSEDKAFLAILTDEAFAHLFSAEERAMIARVVPWTRRMEERHTEKDGARVDLVPYVLAHRESLVLKPAHGYGGASVFVGDHTTAAEWEGAVKQGLGGEAWVVQERVTIPEEPFPVFDGSTLRFEPFKVNANPFYVQGMEVGAVTRASRSAVINVSAGGGSLPTFVVG